MNTVYNSSLFRNFSVRKEEKFSLARGHVDTKGLKFRLQYKGFFFVSSSYVVEKNGIENKNLSMSRKMSRISSARETGFKGNGDLNQVFACLFYF